MAIAYLLKKRTKRGKVWHIVSNTKREHEAKKRKYKNMKTVM